MIAPRQSGAGTEPAQQKQAHYERFCRTHPLKTADLPDATWRYIDCGRGARTILMVHGLAGDATGFYRLTEALEGEYRVIAPTVPALHTMDGVCRGCEALLGHTQVGPVIVLGASWGGMVAQSFLHRYPDRVEAVILADTSGPDPTMARRNARQHRILSFVPWWLARTLFRSGIQKLLQVPGELSEQQEAELQFQRSRLTGRLANLSRAQLSAQSRAAQDFLGSVSYTAEEFRAWSGQMLIFQSADDPGLKPADHGHTWDTLYPGAQVVTMRGAGHLGLVLRLDDYVREIRSFLSGLQRRPG